MPRKEQEGIEATDAGAAPAMVTTAEVPAATAMQPFYVGLTADCPFDYITVPTEPGEGAIAVQKYTQRLSDDGHGVYALSNQIPGGIIELFEDEAKAVKTYVLGHSIFWESKGENKRVRIIPNEGEGSKRSRRDDFTGRLDPLGKYVWLTPARNVTLEASQGTHLPQTIGGR